MLPRLLAWTLASRASAGGQHREANSFPQLAVTSPVWKKNPNSNFKFCNQPLPNERAGEKPQGTW